MATLDALAAAMTTMQSEVAQQKHALEAMHAMMAGATNTQTTEALEQKLQAFAAEAKSKFSIEEQRWCFVQPSVATLNATTSALTTRMDQLEHQASTSSGTGHDGKTRWQLTRPKDMVPDVFTGK